MRKNEREKSNARLKGGKSGEGEGKVLKRMSGETERN